MRTIILGTLCAIAMVASAKAEIKEVPVTYTDGTTTMKGFVVYDDATTAKRPGIIMVHEWWGITPHVHNEAKKFAQQGYTAFIADMFGDAKNTAMAEPSGSAMALNCDDRPAVGTIPNLLVLIVGFNLEAELATIDFEQFGPYRDLLAFRRGAEVLDVHLEAYGGVPFGEMRLHGLDAGPLHQTDHRWRG